MTWVHWVLYSLPVNSTGLPEAVQSLPAGTLDGPNDWPRVGYGGPCPPTGRHRCFHKLYPLDVVLADLKRPTEGLGGGDARGMSSGKRHGESLRPRRLSLTGRCRSEWRLLSRVVGYAAVSGSACDAPHGARVSVA